MLLLKRGVLHVSRDEWKQYPTGADEILCFPLQISRNSPRKPLSALPLHVKQEGALLPPQICYGLYFVAVTPLLRRCIQPTASLLHLPGPSLQGRASAQRAGVSGIPVWHCSHFFSFHRVWAREGSGKDALVSCYPGRKDFSFFLSCIAKEEPQPESGLCAHAVLGHCTQQEKPMSI